ERHRIPVPPFPVQNALTRPMRTAAAKAGDADGLSLWAGQGVGMVRPQPAAELFARLVEESEQVLRGLSVD
ncbi:MAG TPA: nitronate monooxygenase, partial [Longimicrobiaceae bacterium]|nr:nitronate monooxygenase [Longimicrobiaceae bacterium]